MAEYAILIALVAICLIGVINVFRSAVGELLSTASTEVSQTSSSGYVPGNSPSPVPAPVRPSGGSGGGRGSAGGVLQGYQGPPPPPPDSADAVDPELPDSLGGDSLAVE